MNRTNVFIPRWASLLYGALAILLIPWILILAEFLPQRHIARHWDAMWVGFDLIMLLTIVMTFYFVVMRKVWVIISGTALATLLLLDAWFDILTSKPGLDQTEAIISGVIEVTLSMLTFRLVYHILHHASPLKDITLNLKRRTNQ